MKYIKLYEAKKPSKDHTSILRNALDVIYKFISKLDIDLNYFQEIAGDAIDIVRDKYKIEYRQDLSILDEDNLSSITDNDSFYLGNKEFDVSLDDNDECKETYNEIYSLIEESMKVNKSLCHVFCIEVHLFDEEFEFNGDKDTIEKIYLELSDLKKKSTSIGVGIIIDPVQSEDVVDEMQISINFITKLDEKEISNLLGIGKYKSIVPKNIISDFDKFMKDNKISLKKRDKLSDILSQGEWLK
jgi:hypothetical protein